MLKEFSEWLVLIATILTSISTIIIVIQKIIQKQFEKVNETIQVLDMNQCLHYLVDFLSDMENGNIKDEFQIKRAYEIYDHYIKDLNGNSYIYEKWNKLMKER